MKLHAKVQKERTVKGQGGHKFLQIQFSVMENGTSVDKCWAQLEEDNLAIFLKGNEEILNYGSMLLIRFKD
jgi:hypothetical protein